MTESPLILALDIGTSSIRASIYDRSGNFLEGMKAQEKYSMELSPDGGVEIDAELLLSIVARSIDSVLELLGEKSKELAAVAVSTFWHSLLGIDAQGRTITPVISWNDTRAAAAAARLREQVSESELHARTGCRAHASYWPAKLFRLGETSPELMSQAHYWLSFADYLYFRLFGETASSVSMASGTGLFNQKDCQWDEKTIELLPVKLEQLPPIVDIDQPLSGLRGEFVARWPALRNIPWYVPFGDGACSNVGSGCVDPSRFAVMVGTSGAMRAITTDNEFIVPYGLWSYRVDRRRRVLGGALSNGGNLFAWMTETLKLPTDPAVVEAELAGLEPDGHGLVILPLFSGERSPGWHDGATATISGLRISTRPIEILRAGLEAIAYQFVSVYESLQESFGQTREVVGTGGGMRNSPVLRQITADVLGTPLRMSAIKEASSRGAALLVLEAMKLIKSDEVGRADFTDLYLPDQENHKRYLQGRKRHQALYDMIFNQSES
jgi:gluconokinase